MFGDHEQLPATVISKAAATAGLGVSYFERVFSAADTPVVKCLLRCQYRMHPEICRFPNHQFYDQQLYTHHSVTARPAPPWMQDSLVGAPYTFFDALESAEAQGGKLSRFNLIEARLTLLIFKRIASYYRSSTVLQFPGYLHGARMFVL